MVLMCVAVVGFLSGAKSSIEDALGPAVSVRIASPP